MDELFMIAVCSKCAARHDTRIEHVCRLQDLPKEFEEVFPDGTVVTHTDKKIAFEEAVKLSTPIKEVVISETEVV